MASVSNNPCLDCETDTYAYPINADYCPIVQVFEAPYESGDCPIIEKILSLEAYEDAGGTWIEDWHFSDTDFDIIVGEEEVFIRDLTNEALEENKDYEIRIYPSDEAVNRQE